MWAVHDRTALSRARGINIVGVTGIEPALSRSRTERDTTSLHPVERTTNQLLTATKLVGGARENRTLRVRHMKPTSPPGDLRAMNRPQDAGESNAVTTALETVPRPSRAS